MSDPGDKKSMAWEIIKVLLATPFVVFREEIEAVLAILLVIAALAITVGAWHYFPDDWYWIAIPSIALLAIAAWPILKFADKVEARFNKRSPRKNED